MVPAALNHGGCEQEVSTSEKLLLLYARHFPLRRGKLSVVNKLWTKVLSDNGTYRRASLKFGRFEMSCDVSEMLQRQFYYFGTYLLEEEIINCWQSMSKGAKTILDVGANAGIYSLAALAVQPDADVYAFEPTPEIAKRLHETASLNALDRLHVQQVAVSTRGGTATLRRFRGELGNNEGMNFISQDPCESDEEKVETVSLDQFCRERSIDKIDLLKLDVQGHEFAALRGAERLIRAGSISTIFMELNWAQSPRSPCPASESIRLLSESNYLFSKPTKHLNWQRPGTWLRASTDIVARQTVRVHRAL